MEYLHPFQNLESREDWKANLDFRWFFADVICISLALFLAVYYAAGVSPITLIEKDLWLPGIITMVIPPVAVFCLRNYVFPKMPRWLKLIIRILCAAICVYGFIRLGASLE